MFSTEYGTVLVSYCPGFARSDMLDSLHGIKCVKKYSLKKL